MHADPQTPRPRTDTWSAGAGACLWTANLVLAVVLICAVPHIILSNLAPPTREAPTMSSPEIPQQAQRGLYFRVHKPGEDAGLVAARLHYDPADPWAVQIQFMVHSIDCTCAPAVTWTFSRDLLAAGAESWSGVGDVRVWPEPKVDRIHIVLDAPDGTIRMVGALSAVSRFLLDAYERVPQGSEHEHQDLDAEIARLRESK